MATLRRMRIAMGTFIAIEAEASSKLTAASAIEAAFAAIGEVEQRMHPSHAGSDVALINEAAPGAKTMIHPSTAEVLRLALLLNKLTDGVFDPCLPAQSGRLADLELDESAVDGAASVICHAPLVLDLGGIAKGYAVDRAVTALRQPGCVAGIVNAGGDLRVFGARPQTVLLRRADRGCEPLVLDNAALAVSDLDEPRRPPEHRGYYDRSTARTGAAGFARRHAAVLAGDAMSADALTKCVLLCEEWHARRALLSLGGQRVS
jgi:thiamine biosynthesis lipoprotein